MLLIVRFYQLITTQRYLLLHNPPNNPIRQLFSTFLTYYTYIHHHSIYEETASIYEESPHIFRCRGFAKKRRLPTCSVASGNSLPSLGHGKTFSLPSPAPLAHSPVGEQTAIHMKKASGVDSKGSLAEKRRLPTLPRVCSTIGAGGLNFSVRNGKRWNPATITT